MGNYAVYHTEKGSSGSGGIGNHIDRTEGKEHTFQHADPERRHLNQNFRVPKDRQSMSLSDAINDRIKEGYNGKRKIRKDAVKFQTHVLTGSHERMKEIFENPELSKKWLQANYKFMQDEFGKENLVRFTLHRDEKTPHLHAITIPLTADGRLSAKEIFGNKNVMQLRQDRYAEMMKSFGLERGMKNTGIRHENAKEYYKRMSQANEEGEKTDFKARKDFLGRYTAESVEGLENTLKSQKTALKSKDLELQKEKEKVKQIAERSGLSKTRLENKSKELENKVIQFLFDEKVREKNKPEIIEKLKSNIIAEAKKIKGSGKVVALDEIVRQKMKEISPYNNPWGTLRENFGDDFEEKIYKILDQKITPGLKQENQEKQQERNPGFKR